MMARPGKSHNVFSLALAAWFIVLSASVHALHIHPDAGCDEKESADLCHIEQRDAPPFVYAYQSDNSGQDQPETRVNGLCPVCLFLAKHMAEQPAAPPGLGPKNGESGRASCDPSIAVISLDRPSAAPRAPPC